MHKTKLMTSSVAILAAAALVATVAAAPDSKPPRIVSAAMQDQDGDFRADGVRLAYSERVRHARDGDGKYPLRVAGYRVRSISKASGKTIVLALVEQATADAAARPAITYRRTSKGAVSDRARNQALAQIFGATKAHGKRPTDTPPPPPPPVTDKDGDGTANEQDCAPDNAAIHPKASDTPDLAFVDSNCDGIDGDETKAIFVSPEGKDENPGTKAQPKREIDVAVATAAGKGKYVLAAAGTYRRVKVASGVGIFGGYDPKTWKRSFSDSTTSIAGSPEGVYAEQAKGVELQLLSVRGDAAADVAGGSAYGIRAIDSTLTLRRVTVRAGTGSPGSTGTTGAAGRPGGNALNGLAGMCDQEVEARGGGGGDGFGDSDGGLAGAGGYSSRDGARGDRKSVV